MSGEMQFTAAYFREEVLRFREIMCSKSYTIAQKEQALRGLSLVYLNIVQTEMTPEIETLMVATSEEWQRRWFYEQRAAIGMAP